MKKHREKGFTIIEVLIAMSVFGITVLLMASLFQMDSRNRSRLRALGMRDLGYFKVAKYAADSAALLKSYNASPLGASNPNPCYRACLEGFPPATSGKCDFGGVTSSRCRSRNGAAPMWYPLTLYLPSNVTTVIAGPHPAETNSMDPNLKNPVRYTREGVVCDPNLTLPADLLKCPIQAVTEFHPICPGLTEECNRATALLVRYTYKWDTANVTSNEIAALQSLGAQVEMQCSDILGIGCPSFVGTATNTGTDTTTGAGTLTGCVELVWMSGSCLSSKCPPNKPNVTCLSGPDANDIYSARCCP